MATNKKVAQAWATMTINPVPKDKRGNYPSSKSMSISDDGTELISYSTTVAKWVNGEAFVSSNKFSPSTAKQLSLLWAPLRSANITAVYVPGFVRGRTGHRDEELIAASLERLHSEWVLCADKVNKSRTCGTLSGALHDLAVNSKTIRHLGGTPPVFTTSERIVNKLVQWKLEGNEVTNLVLGQLATA